MNDKIVCLGGGSLYFKRVLPDLIANEELAGSEIVIYDIDGEKAERMAAAGRSLARSAVDPFTVKATTELAEAVEGADFAISSIGGSGAGSRGNVYASRLHNVDMRIPAQYGIEQVIGDTCGPAAMMMAFRSIPAYMEICEEMEKRCPDAILFNHSNPMAPLCKAVRKYTEIDVIGICHGVQAGLEYAAEILNCSLKELDAKWIGTNHYYWFTSVVKEGEELLPRLMEKLQKRESPPGKTLSAELSRIYGYPIVYPQDDHIVEFYPFLAQVKGGQEALPYDLAESAKDHGYDASEPSPSSSETPSREEFLRTYEEELGGMELPEKPSDPYTGEGIARMLGAIATGKRRTCIVNLANEGTIPNLSPEGEVEVEGVTDSSGITPLRMGEAPLQLKGILEKRFVWQELVADAAVRGDRQQALQALLADEMAIWPEEAEEMLEELLQASKGSLPQFFPQTNA